jgi:hypothetical protein
VFAQNIPFVRSVSQRVEQEIPMREHFQIVDAVEAAWRRNAKEPALPRECEGLWAWALVEAINRLDVHDMASRLRMPGAPRPWERELPEEISEHPDALALACAAGALDCVRVLAHLYSAANEAGRVRAAAGPALLRDMSDEANVERAAEALLAVSVGHGLSVARQQGKSVYPLPILALQREEISRRLVRGFADCGAFSLGGRRAKVRAAMLAIEAGDPSALAASLCSLRAEEVSMADRFGQRQNVSIYQQELIFLITECLVFQSAECLGQMFDSCVGWGRDPAARMDNACACVNEVNQLVVQCAMEVDHRAREAITSALLPLCEEGGERASIVLLAVAKDVHPSLAEPIARAVWMSGARAEAVALDACLPPKFAAPARPAAARL